MNSYIATKYKGKWSVLDSKTKVYYFIGSGKLFCENKAKELNDLIRIANKPSKKRNCKA